MTSPLIICARKPLEPGGFLESDFPGKAMKLELLASLGWQEVPILIFAVLLGLVFFLVLRQNQEDYLDLKGTLASEDE